MAKTQIGELYYRITGDNSGLKNSLDSSDNQANKFMGTLGKVGKAIAGAFVVKQVYDFAKGLVTAASDANETASKFGTVFSSISGAANQTAADIAASYGLSNTAAKDYLSGVGDILTGLEFTQQASLDTSASIVGLSADLVSFKNYSGGVEGAQQAITSALLGEREALKGLGIAISDADLQKFAADSGKVWKELSKQEQATLTLELITKRAGNAVGDFARTQLSFANQIRVAESGLQNLQETLGSKLLPVASLGVIAFNSMLKEINASAVGLSDWATSAEGSAQIASFFSNVLGSISAAAVLLSPVLSGIGDIFVSIYDSFADGIPLLLGASQGMGGMATTSLILSNVLTILGTILGGIITTMFNFANVVLEAGQTLFYFLGLLTGQVSLSEFKDQIIETGEAITNLGNGVLETGQKIIEQSKEMINSFTEDSANLTNEAQLAMEETANNTQQTIMLALANTSAAMDSETKKGVDAAKKNLEEFDKKTIDSINKVSTTATSIGNSIVSLMSSITNSITSSMQSAREELDTTHQQYLSQLELEYQAQLEAAGLADETQLQSLQNQLAAATEAGDAETIARLEDDIQREQLHQDYLNQVAAAEEQYQREAAQLEYKAAHAAWEGQIASAISQGALGAINAFASGFRIDPTGILSSISLGLVLATTAVNLDILNRNEPPRPSFELGGIVPGTSFTGDNVGANLNSGEMVLTRDQQSNLFNMVNNGAGGTTNISVNIGGEELSNVLYNMSKNGSLRIHEGAIVSI